MRNKILVLLVTFIIHGASADDSVKLMIRCDDMGMSHAVNQAFEQLAQAEIPFSASVMVPCPWFTEAVEILSRYPHVSAGIHLTLNSEWKNYRWGPILGKGSVPSLVDSLGYFHPSRAKFFANNPELDEVEAELRAQIVTALAAGLKVDYVDYHMGTAVQTPEMRKIVEKLAEEFELGISRYFNEWDMDKMYDDPIDSKQDSMMIYLDNMDENRINLLVCHIGLDLPELNAMIDLNEFGLKDMSKHRHSELQVLLSDRFKKKLEDLGLKLMTYHDLIELNGIESMRAPLESGY
jgi:hypothetical protein